VKYPVGIPYWEAEGPGRGWWVPPHGTHGAGDKKDEGAWRSIIERQEKKIVNITTREHGMAVAEDGTILIEKSGTPTGIKFTETESKKMIGPCSLIIILTDAHLQIQIFGSLYQMD